MAAPLQTLELDSHYSIFRAILSSTRATPLGAGATQVRDRYSRPCYRFTLKDSHAVPATAEYLYSFMQYHRGSQPFWFSGNSWGVVTTPVLFGFGDGVRTQFFLNNRHVHLPFLTVYHQDPPVAYAGAAWSRVGNVVTFVAPPTDDATLSLRTDQGMHLVFGTGDGVTTVYSLAKFSAYVYTGMVLYAEEPPDPYLTSEWSLDGASGLLSFTGTPTDQSKLSAIYTCSYKCTFEVEGDILQDQELFYHNLSRFEGIKLREVIP